MTHSILKGATGLAPSLKNGSMSAYDAKGENFCFIPHIGEKERC
jgi:hypothetical protein